MVQFKISPCPRGCGRLTYPRRRVLGTYRLTPEQEALVKRLRAFQCVLVDGTCQMCWMALHGYGRGGPGRENDPRHYKKYPPGYTPPATEADLAKARVLIGKYWEDRRRRGIPEEGLSVDTLVRPGLFCKDVA